MTNPLGAPWAGPYPVARHIQQMRQRVEPSFGLSLRSFHYLQQFR
jgi:hypothetical protein